MGEFAHKLEIFAEFETLHKKDGIKVKAHEDHTMIFICNDEGYLSAKLEIAISWIDCEEKIQTEELTHDYFELSLKESIKLRDFLVYALSGIELKHGQETAP